MIQNATSCSFISPMLNPRLLAFLTKGQRLGAKTERRITMTNGSTYRERALQNPELFYQLVGQPRKPREGEQFNWTEHAARAQKALATAIGMLREEDQDILIARFGEEITLKEYGERLEVTKERARTIESRALRRLRTIIYDKMEIASLLCQALEVVYVPGGPLDPAWLTVEEAQEITGLSIEHLRYLCRDGKVEARRLPTDRRFWHISRESLKKYVLEASTTGQWKEVNANAEDTVL